MNKFLYITISVSLLLSASLCISFEMGQVVYLTADKSIIGSRPSRLFGFLSLGELSFDQVFFILDIIYLFTTLTASLALFLFLKDIKSERRRIAIFFGIMIAVMIIIDYNRYMFWDYTVISLYISMTLVAFSFYFLIQSDVKILAPIFAAAAQLMDCRAFLFILPGSILVIFLKKLHKENKHIKLLNMLMIVASSLILALSFISVDFTNKADEDAIDEAFIERYMEYGMDPENITEAQYAFKFRAYLTVTPQELFSDMLTYFSSLSDIPYEDHIQLICALFFVTIILYDNKDITTKFSA